VKLRPYQQEGVDSIIAGFEQHSSLLAVAATGLGKTIMFAHVCKRRIDTDHGRCLVLAHTSELVFQAADKIESVTGIRPDIEMAEHEADARPIYRSPIIVGTVQTQVSGRDTKRMHRFDPREFGTIIIDEAHRAVANTYLEIKKHYCGGNSRARMLGVTATPDRTDGRGLIQAFEHLACNFDILFGVTHGWLVPIRQRSVVIESLDFSEVKTTAGDLNGSDLAAVMEEEKPLHEVAGAAIRECGDRRTLVFASSVHHAELLADIFNRQRPGSARWLCGKTPKPERDLMLQQFALGRYQYLVNVDVLIEGFDDPGIEVIVIARPTKSRSRYTQMIGRGTRTLTGLIDGIDSEEERIKAIAASAKPHVEIIDFRGNAGQHKLITTADILGVAISAEAKKKAEKRAESESVDMMQALGEAAREAAREAERRKQEELERRRNLVASVDYSTRDIDPFDIYDIRRAGSIHSERIPPATRWQVMQLERFGLPTRLNRAEAARLIKEEGSRRNGGMATFNQMRTLANYGIDGKDLTQKQAVIRLAECLKGVTA